MKKIIFIISFIILISSCRIFSAMQPLVGTIEGTIKYIEEELE